LKDFKRAIKVYKNHFWDFYNAQPKKVQDRIDWTIGLIQSLKIVPKKYFDHMTGTNGLWRLELKLGIIFFEYFAVLTKEILSYY
jgi:hypothetical protein